MAKLHHLPRWIAVSLVLLAGWAAPPPLAQADNLDTIADDVLGQADFTHNAANTPSLGASSLNQPAALALSAQGDLYVADASNNRVLEYDTPFAAGADHIADRVFGQLDFTHKTANPSGVAATSLSSPTGLALDALGDLYVVDTGNNRVLEYVAPLTSGMPASRVFGQGGSFTSATANKSGLSGASLASPFGVALDTSGNLYVADGGNHRVLEYDWPPSASADNVFGQADFVHGLANRGLLTPTTHSLNNPVGLAVDIQHNLYVADSGNNRVLEYNNPLATDGNADRVFGQPDFIHKDINNGGLSDHSLNGPRGVALDARGDLYIADTVNNRVLEYNTPLASGVIADRVFGQGGSFTTAGINQGGLGPSSLNSPQAVAVGAGGSLYVADLFNHRVLEFDVPVPRGLPLPAAISPSTVAAGSPDFTLTVTGAGFYGVSVVRWNGSSRPTTFINSTVLTATISAADISGGGPFAVTVFTPAPGGGTSTLINLTRYNRAGHDLSADEVQGQPDFVTNTSNNPNMLGANHLNDPSHVAIDLHSGRLFVADKTNNRVLSWPSAAALANGQAADLVLGQPNFAFTALNENGRSARSLAYPFGIALDAHGNLYVADEENSRVLEYSAPLSSGMAASRVFGQGGSFTTGTANNGGVSANSLNVPQDVALDASGDLYVADTSNHRVLEYDTPLTTDTAADRVFGQADMASHSSNRGVITPTASSLSAPEGVALDLAGNLYVAEANNSRVLAYHAPLSTGMAASQVFGQDGNFSTAVTNNGGISADSLYLPGAMAVDAWGNLYVVDGNNCRVLEFDTPLTSGTTADRVFGQPDFVSGVFNNGGIGDNRLSFPQGVALDAHGNLYVADYGNDRVLEFDWALVNLALPLVVR